ncbi:hypothetical protein J6590_096369 [Homalodisca vitripennis]|nr:hypothetical protein J6590_096369 [Homalodisca vitripennis]
MRGFRFRQPGSGFNVRGGVRISGAQTEITDRVRRAKKRVQCGQACSGLHEKHIPENGMLVGREIRVGTLDRIDGDENISTTPQGPDGTPGPGADRDGRRSDITARHGARHLPTRERRVGPSPPSFGTSRNIIQLPSVRRGKRRTDSFPVPEEDIESYMALMPIAYTARELNSHGGRLRPDRAAGDDFELDRNGFVKSVIDGFSDRAGTGDDEVGKVGGNVQHDPSPYYLTLLFLTICLLGFFYPNTRWTMAPAFIFSRRRKRRRYAPNIEICSPRFSYRASDIEFLLREPQPYENINELFVRHAFTVGHPDARIRVRRRTEFYAIGRKALAFACHGVRNTEQDVGEQQFGGLVVQYRPNERQTQGSFRYVRLLARKTIHQPVVTVPLASKPFDASGCGERTRRRVSSPTGLQFQLGWEDGNRFDDVNERVLRAAAYVAADQPIPPSSTPPSPSPSSVPYPGSSFPLGLASTADGENMCQCEYMMFDNFKWVKQRHYVVAKDGREYFDRYVVTYRLPNSNVQYDMFTYTEGLVHNRPIEAKFPYL